MYDEYERFGDDEYALENARGGVDAGGLGGLAMYMAAAAAGPAVAKWAGRAAIREVGKRAVGAQASVSAIRERVATQARTGAGTAAEAAAVRNAIRKDPSRLARARQAAAYEFQSGEGGGDVSISRFLGSQGSGRGYRGLERLKSGGDVYDAWRKTKPTRTAALKSILNDPGQRRVLGSLAKKVAFQQAAEMPVMYALDQMAGITTGPGERAAWNDPVGQAKQFAEWLPQYAGMEALSRGAMKAPKLAAEQLHRLEGKLGRHPALARQIGRLYEGAFDTIERTRDVATSARNLHAGRVGAAAGPMGKAEHGVSAGRQFYGDLKRARQARRSATPHARALSAAARSLQADASLRGATEMFGGGRWAGLAKRMVGYNSDADGALYKRLFQHSFAKPGEKAAGAFGKVFGAETATLGDLDAHIAKLKRKSGPNVPAALQRELRRAQDDSARAREGVDKFRDHVLGSAATREDVRGFVEGHVRADNLRLSGYVKVNGQLVRAPTGGEIRQKAGQFAVRATTINRQLSVARLFQAHTFTAARPDVERVQGTMTIDNKAVHFGENGPSRFDNTYSDGYYVANRPGSSKGSILGFRRDGHHFEEVARDKTILSSLGNSKLHSIAMRVAGAREEPAPSEAYQRARKAPGGRVREFVSEHFGIGNGTSPSIFERARDAVGARTPRRLFGRKSPLYAYDRRTPLDEGGYVHGAGFHVAQAVSTLRQATLNATDVYAREDVLRMGVARLGWSQEALEKYGGVRALATDDRAAYRAARDLLDEPRNHNDPRYSPSAAQAKKIVREVEREGIDALFNATGRSRGQDLRRFLFEEGMLGGAGASGSAPGALRDAGEMIARLGETGALSAEAAAEARAGLLHLRMRAETGKTYKDPYNGLASALGGRLEDVDGLGAAAEFFRRNAADDGVRETLETFAQTRPVIDLGYHSQGYHSADEFSAGLREADVMAVSGASALQLGAAYGLETLRSVFGSLGLGWDVAAREPGATGLDLKGELGYDVWKRRAGAVVAATVAWRVADAAVDSLLPDDAPFGQGLTVATADAFAGVRSAQAHLFDATGVTAAAQWAEGLMPKSTTQLPGMVAGYFLGGRSAKSALAGGVANRVLHEALKDTPIEFLAPDLAQDSERVAAVQQGEEWVMTRKGRGFILSTSDFAGGRVAQFRPGWYARTKADVGSSDVLYGSDWAEAIHKPLPLVDFAIGDLWAPQFLQDKHYYDRPYVAPRTPFSEIPILGPTLGRSVGRLYNALHPNASNRPLHMESVVGMYAGEGSPATGRALAGAGTSQALVPSGVVGFGGVAAVGSLDDDPTVMSTSARGYADEQFYRIAEAMGFQGFIAQQAAGGEGLFRDPVFAAAGEMSAPGRTFHDENLGDMLGVGEALRRFYPFARNAERVGPENQMADWMPESFQTGDPYCLLPDTLVELDGRLVRAEDAHAAVTAAPGEHTARTHQGRRRKVVAAAERPVAEDVVSLTVGGLPWDLVVTAGHPVLVARSGRARWVLAGDVAVGDTVVLPVGPDERGVAGSDKSSRWDLPQSGVTAQAILALRALPVPDGDRFSTAPLPDDDLWRVETAFGLPGSPVDQRRSGRAAHVRRQMQDGGLPPGVVGMGPGPLSVLVGEWGRIEHGGITVDVTAGALGLEPGHPADAVTQGAYRLWRALLAAGVASDLSETAGGYRLRIVGDQAARLVYSETERKGRRWRKTLWGEGAVRHHRPLMGKGRLDAAVAPVTAAARVRYDGPVYAFEVAGDASFVAAGVATHNSKIMKGEMLLPGAGFEQLVAARQGTELDASNLGVDEYETMLRTLDVVRDRETDMGSWAKQNVTQLLRDAGMAVREEVVFADAANRTVAVADASTMGNQPIVVRALSNSDWGTGPDKLDLERLNLTLGVGGRTSGALVYVNEDTGEMQSYRQEYDAGQYYSSVRRLRRGRDLALEASASGFGAAGATYSTLDRLQVLVNADPFGAEFRTEMKKARALSAAGAFDPGEQRYHARIEKQREYMSIPFEVFGDRFDANQLMDPDSRVMMTNFNEHVRAASTYSLSERFVGMAWESWSNLRSPLHGKFFGNPNLETQYENRVLLGRDFQDWGHPVRDFAQPYARGLRAADDPVQGALAFGTGAATFLGGPWTALGAVAGAAYGAAHGAYRGATDTRYVPGSVEETRGVESAFDRLRYYRANSLYEATGSESFKREAQGTAFGFYQQGLSEGGYGQANRHRDTGGTDRGFGSPYQGQDPERSLTYTGDEPFGPMMMNVPDEMLGAFRAVPKSERQFLKAALGMTDRGQQAEFLKLVSQDFGAVLDQSWAYLYDQDPFEVSMDPMRQMALPASHPAMGLGADLEGYQVRTMEDLGLDAHDAGVGWRDSMLRLDRALAPPVSLAGAMRGEGAVQDVPSTDEVKAIIKGALAQFGILADVVVQETHAPTEIQIHQSL